MRSYRAVVKNVVPRRTVEFGRFVRHTPRRRRAAAALASAPVQHESIGLDALPRLAARFPSRSDLAKATVGTATAGAGDPVAAGGDHYSPETPDAVRADLVRRELSLARRVLDVGAGHGLVAWGLQSDHRQVVASDLWDDPYPAALDAGVEFHRENACALSFDDASFDAAYSLDTFEHIDEPDRALSEMLRVVRPGGRVHLSFAPVYNAPFGLHAWHTLGVPFCQHLWEPDEIREHFGWDPFAQLNGWSVGQYRRMFRGVAGQARTVSYIEERDYAGIDLIAKHPGRFARVSRDIDELIVSKFRVTLEKRQSG